MISESSRAITWLLSSEMHSSCAHSPSCTAILTMLLLDTMRLCSPSVARGASSSHLRWGGGGGEDKRAKTDIGYTFLIWLALYFMLKMLPTKCLPHFVGSMLPVTSDRFYLVRPEFCKSIHLSEGKVLGATSPRVRALPEM